MNNPYQVPPSGFDADKGPELQDGQPADRYRRALNLVFDLLVSYGLMMVVLYVLWALGLFTVTGTLDLIKATPAWALWPVFLFFYYLVSEAVWGRTIAKLMTGTRVTGRDGRAPALGAVFIRTVVRFVPFEFVTFLQDVSGEAGWHDRWSGTRVVRTD